MTYSIFSGLLGLAGAAAILILIRRNVLYVRYAAWWFCVACGAAVLGVFPRITDIVAKYFGIGYPPVIVLVGALVLLLIKVLNMDIERSRQEVRVRRLTQRVALLQAVVEERGILVSDEIAGNTSGDMQAHNSPQSDVVNTNAESANHTPAGQPASGSPSNTSGKKVQNQQGDSAEYGTSAGVSTGGAKD